VNFLFDILTILILAAIAAWGAIFFAHFIYSSFKVKKIQLGEREWLIAFIFTFVIVFFVMYFTYSAKKHNEETEKALGISDDVPVVFYPLKDYNGSDSLEFLGSEWHKESNTSSDINQSGRKESPQDVIRKEIELENKYPNAVILQPMKTDFVEIEANSSNKISEEKNQKISKTKDGNISKENEAVFEGGSISSSKEIDPETGAPYTLIGVKNDNIKGSVRVLEQLDENKTIIYDETTSREILKDLDKNTLERSR